MAATLHSPLSSALSSSFSHKEKKLGNRVLFMKPSFVFETRLLLPSIRAATNFSSSLDPGLSTELDSVANFSEIVPDTVVFDDFERFPPTAATVSSSLILGICSLPDTKFKSAVDTALADSVCYNLEKSDDRMACFFNKALVNIGGDLAKLVPGRVSTEVDARLAYDTHAIVRKVHHLLKLYHEIGVPPERLLFKIPSTWQGIEASRLLESEGIQTHMTLVYSFCQAAAAAQAGASVIQIFVGRLRDWARNHTGDSEVEAALRRGEDPGLALVTKAYNYIHKYGHKSRLMAAAIRNKQDVFNLLGVDYIISPLKILQSLKESVTPPDEKYSLMRRLSTQSAASYTFRDEELVKWDQYSFASALGPAATELLTAGINGYSNQSERVEELFGKIWPPPNPREAPSAASAHRSPPSATCVYLLLAVTILATSPRNPILLITLAAGSTMGKKKSDESAAGTKAKQSSKEKLSVSAMLASMDSKPDKPKKGPTSSKPKPKAAPKLSSYTDGIDLPSSDEEEDDMLGSEEEQKQYDSHRNPSRQTRTESRPLDINISNKELKKREKKDLFANQAAELAKQEALMDDRDAFTVVIGSRASVLDGEDEADANVKDITIDNFSVSARGKELLKNASVKISHGKRYGLVGPNGKGKSTLLKLLAWRKIPVPKNIDVLLVEQEVVGDDRTALEAVVSANEELIKLRQEVASLQDDASNVPAGEEEDDAGGKLSELYEKLQLMGSDAAEAQASKILAGLGFTKDMQCRATRSFSGGWRMRISLARALFVQPTLLLLDEPTNHLDLRAVLWLEEYLCRWKKTLVVVSHDRDFLNTVCNEIIHLHDMKLHLYRGNFDEFEVGYEQRRKEMNKKFEIYDKQVKAAKRSGSRAQQEKVKDRAKFNAAKEASKNKGKGKVVDEDEPLPEAPQKWRDYTVEFHFPEPTELTPPLLQLIEVSFSYPNRKDFRLSNVDVGIDMGTRVAIVGPNGAGKSTLLNLLAGDLEPSEGEVRRSQKLRIGRYSQHFVDLLTMNETPVQYLLRLHPDQEGLSKQEAVRAKLGKFGLPSHNHLTPIAKLSGGQKARVVFASISMAKPHILLLDEPTNHLDMQSIDALADALDEFSGGVVLVSHDSRLISRVCEDEERSEIWEVKNGTVKAFPGSFEEYKEELVKEIRAEVDD
ncbi:ABC transporter F family member 4 [Striga asiatica]|uniref:transaldolase n=1 Tax=Striga asiatica TaxID=4170 RepID=A0A5A7PC53_STRAF|nr:ABC transporter F family member 4 [Striga asiatica]